MSPILAQLQHKKMQNFVSVLVVLIATIMALLYSRILLKSLRTPFTLLAAMWGTSLILYFLSPVSYTNLSTNTLIAIASYIGMAFAGTLIGSIAYHKLVEEEKYSYQVRERYLIVVSAVTLIGAILFLATVISTVGLGALIYEPNVVRAMHFTDEIQIGKFAGTYAVGFLFATSILSGIKSHADNGYKYLIIPIMSAVIIDFGYVGRIYLITTVFLLVVARTLSFDPDVKTKPIPLWAIIPIISLAVTILIFASNARTNSSVDDSNWISLYVYFTSPWLVLDTTLINKTTDALGAETFYPVALALSKLDLFSLENYVSTVFNYTQTPYGILVNTPTAIGLLYTDFGMPGVIIFSLTFYMIAGYYFRKYQRTGDAATVVILTLIYYVSFISLHGLPFGISFIVAIISIIPAIRRTAIRREW